MPTAPTPITPLPTAPSRADPANFPARADAFLAALPTFGSQLNANASAAFGNASEAATAANNAAASQTSAAASATAAAASAVTAVNAPGTSGTSTTSLTIGTGSQTVTTQTGKAWVVGQFVTVASTASPTNFMHGQITAYNSGTGSMTVNVLAVGGSGTLASWTIGLVGPNATLTDQNSLQPVALTLPSIRPSLLLDFANAKRLDPRVTFTRATSGTYYDGVTTAKAEENLLLRSQDFSATWTLANLTAGSAVTAPDGTATGSSFTASAANGTLTQSVTAVAGDHTFSVWLRRVSGTGNIDITAHSGGTWVTQTITSSWARYTVTQTLTAGARTPGIRIVTSGDQIEVWGAQLEQRSAATAYTPTTTQPITNYVPQLLTAPAGVPRFDHNPTTGESLGLLVEEQRTNQATQSQTFSNWNLTEVTRESNSQIAPDGTLSAVKIIPSTNVGGHSQEWLVLLGAGTFSFSVYAKAAGYTRLGMRVYDGADYRISATFDLSTGAVVSALAGTASIIPVGNDWYRCVCTGTSVSGNMGSTAGWVIESLPSGVTVQEAFAGNGWSGAFVWGAQIEAGAFPTSYIPTTSASVTRTADDASMTGVNFSSWFNRISGTLLCNAQNLNGTSASPPLVLTAEPFYQGAGGYRLGLAGFWSSVTQLGTDAWANGLSLGGVVVYVNETQAAAGTIRHAFTYSPTECRASVKQTLSAVGGNQCFRAAQGVDRLLLRQPLATISSRISRITYWPALLSGAQLQALTA